MHPPERSELPSGFWRRAFSDEASRQVWERTTPLRNGLIWAGVWLAMDFATFWIHWGRRPASLLPFLLTDAAVVFSVAFLLWWVFRRIVLWRRKGYALLFMAAVSLVTMAHFIVQHAWGI